MGLLTLFLSKALLCAAAQCWPVLVGRSTPADGSYTIVQRYTTSQGYGGDVLQFKEDDRGIYAIHRVWLGNPKERRLERLKDPNPKNRIISNGCVNVDPGVYDYLVENYSGSTLTIVP